MCMFYLHVCIYMYCMHAWCPGRLVEDIRSFGTEITGGELPCMCVLGSKPTSTARIANALLSRCSRLLFFF